ncbi:MAG: UPF0147 family protein [Candidatus Methanomethylophilaceae archaeon]|nr:UPF0147 family protein [Candidatus Methanomethylophilaceae archaeon]
MADSIKQINDVLDMLAEDTSVPRNIRKGATDAKARLMNTKEPMDVRATSAIVFLDDLANDPNIPLHGRSLIWNIIRLLEVLSQQKRFFLLCIRPLPVRGGGITSFHQDDPSAVLLRSLPAEDALGPERCRHGQCRVQRDPDYPRRLLQRHFRIGAKQRDEAELLVRQLWNRPYPPKLLTIVRVCEPLAGPLAKRTGSPRVLRC